MAGLFSNAVVLITGASRGIGLAITQAFAREGASLCLIARKQDALNALVDTLDLPPSKVMTLALDVTHRDACFDAVDQTIKRMGHIDTLVNNAGIYQSQPFLNHTAADFQNMF
jgi:NADP-dependent 3-hydroxy acid dehydrogenase YdfG